MHVRPFMRPRRIAGRPIHPSHHESVHAVLRLPANKPPKPQPQPQPPRPSDFVFYADRLNRLVVEAGLGFLPFTERSVITPTGNAYSGVGFARKLCGVSIIRSGEAMEAALRACCKGIKLGKILVHR